MRKDGPLVERMYTALARLSGVTLGLGLLNLLSLALSLGQQVYWGAGFPSGLPPTLLMSDAFVAFRLATSFLMDGVAILAIVMAWADRRGKWLVVLVVMAGAATLTPVALQSQYLFLSFLSAHPRVGQLLAQSALLMIYTSPLLPVALALAFARMPGGRAALRAEADAALEITRSRL